MEISILDNFISPGVKRLYKPLGLGKLVRVYTDESEDL